MHASTDWDFGALAAAAFVGGSYKCQTAHTDSRVRPATPLLGPNGEPLSQRIASGRL